MTAGLRSEASALVAAGRHEEALPVLARLAEREPRDPDILSTLGVTRYRLGDHAGALADLARARAEAPGDAAIAANIAIISSEVGPADLPSPDLLAAETWNTVGLNAYFRGDFAIARAQIERAVTLKPDYYAAWHNLADLIEADEAEDWLRRAEALAPERAEDAAAIAYMMGHLLDMLGEWGRAAASWTRGGLYRRASFETPYDPRGHAALADGIIRDFSADAIARLSQPGGGEGLTFVVGMPRSGSTLIARLLATDRSARDLGETRAFPQALIAELERIGGGVQAAPGALTAEGVGRISAAYLAAAGAGPRIDKYLETYLFLGILHAALPGARIIHALRDPYDMMVSCFSKNFTLGNAWSYRPQDIRAHFDIYRRVMDHWRAVLPEGVMIDCAHEALTEAPEDGLAALAAHTGLSPDGSAPLAGGRVETASALQVRGGVTARKGSRYEGYRPYLSF